MKRLGYLAIPVCAAIALLVGTLAQGQDSDNNNGGFNNGFITTDGDAIFSRARIVEFDNRIMRLDTATGELSRFRGNSSGSNARGTFVSFARPVNGGTSGFLEVQQVGDAVFLVDAQTGQTWVLRQRSNNLAAWIEVDVLD